MEKDIFKIFDFKIYNRKFDIIFLDPPYKEKKLSILLNRIIESDILNKEGIIIIHRHKKDEEELPKNFNIIEEKNYGISKIIFGNYF